MPAQHVNVLHFTCYFVEFVIAWEKQIVVVVWFLLSFFGRLPVGEVMGLIYFKLYQLELHHQSQLIFTRISLHFNQKQKPGETLYAELRDLDQRQRPNKPSYPDALPPVKRPSPYERTDYAEITHFIKGDVNGQQQMWSPNGTKEPWIGMQMFC